MAPLDTGSVMNMRLVDPLGERLGPSPNDHGTVGEYLRALREFKGLTLGELADSTRIRRQYLQGIEEGDRSSLPARPFAIGYVRSYAQALGIDGDAAAARFKKETPEVAEPFRDPVGVAHEKRKRSPLIFASVALVLAGVLLWNVVQRTMVQEDRDHGSLPPPADVADAGGPPKPVVSIGAPTPAPASQNLPTPYQTPGLDGQAVEMKAGLPVVQQAAATAPAPGDNAVFAPKGAVYGAPAGPNAFVVVQARKPASLIVRGNGGAVFFARQLAAGEAFRAPAGEGLTAEVVDPAAFTIYVAEQNKGALVSQQTSLDKLAVRPAAPTPSAAHPVTTAVAQPAAAAPPPVRAAQATPVRAVRRPRPQPDPRYQDPRYQQQPDGYYQTQGQAEPPQGDVAYYPQRRN